MQKSREQTALQESAYLFPYHHVPKLRDQNFSQIFNFRWGYEYLSYIFRVIGRVEEHPFQSLLDVGCGDGRLLCELALRQDPSCLTGIDTSERAIGFARVFNSGINWVVGDVEQHHFERQFDVITLVETLEHIEPSRVDLFLSELSRLIASNGRLIITVPSENIPVQKHHYQHFSTVSIESTLSSYFNIQEIEFLNEISGIELSVMKKILSNKLFVLNNEVILRFVFKRYVTRHLVTRDGRNRRILCVCTKKANV